MNRYYLLPLVELALLAPLACVGTTEHAAGRLLGSVGLLALVIYFPVRGLWWWSELRTSRALEKAITVGEHLAGERDSAREHATEAKQEIAKVQAANQAQLGKLSASLATERQRANRAEADAQKLNHHLVLLRSEVNTLKETAEKHRAVAAERDSLQGLLSGVRAQLTATEGDLSRAAAEAHEYRTALEQQAARAEDDRTRMGAQIDSLTHQATDLADELEKEYLAGAGLATRAAAAQDEARGLRGELSDLRDVIKGLEAETATLRAEAVAAGEKFQTRLAAGNARAEEAEAEARRLAGEADRSRQRKEEAEELLRLEVERGEGLAGRVETAEEAARELQAEIYQLRRSLKELETEAADAAETRRHLARAEAALEESRQEQRRTQRELDAAALAEADARQAAEASAKAAAGLEEELARTRTERNEARLAAAAAQDRVRELEAAAGTHQAELESERTRATELEDLLAARETSAERVRATIMKKVGELTAAVEAGDAQRFDLQQRLDSALEAVQRLGDRAERLAENLAQSQSRLAEAERQLAAGIVPEPPPSELLLELEAKTDRVAELESAVAARDAEIQWLLEQQANLWDWPRQPAGQP